MQVKSIAECSKGGILQYFWPSISYHLSFRSLLFFVFLSGCFTQFYCILLFTFSSSYQVQGTLMTNMRIINCQSLLRQGIWSFTSTISITDARLTTPRNCDRNIKTISKSLHASRWAPTQENLSSRFLTKSDSNQPAQLQRLARKLKFCP